MQNPSSIKIPIRITHLKDEEQTICELHILCLVLSSSRHLKVLLPREFGPKKKVNDFKILKKVLEFKMEVPA